MKKRILFALVMLLLAVAASAQTWLSQGWSPQTREWVYTTAQGSKLIPFDWAMALERPNDQTMFFADKGVRFGFLPGPSTLPIGIVEDKNLDGTSHLGITCAACHTRDVRYAGKTIRIDGGGADSDLQAFLAEMSSATAATSKSLNDPKFDRFAKRVLGPNPSEDARKQLFTRLKNFANGYAKFIIDSTPSTPWGRSRTDAFSMIFNRVTAIDLKVPSNSRKPNAPVSYPFLWDTTYFDKVQYDGGVPNESVLERLGRNVGEVLGVFAEVRMNTVLPKPVPPVMQSTAKRLNLLSLEDWWSELRAPKWTDPAIGLPPIDSAKQARGQAIYNQNCLSCHAMITPAVRQKVTLVPLATIGTDDAMVNVSSRRMANPGPLRGVWKNLIPFGKRFGDIDKATAVTGHVGISVILTPEISPRNPSPNGGRLLPEVASASRESAAEEAPPLTNNDRDDPERARVAALLSGGASRESDGGGDLETSLRAFGARAEGEKDTREYRARPLDGIWATGPFLHNGSVPTLHDLLLPPAQRPRTFFVGDCEIDTVKVGCVSTAGPNQFLFDTSKPGNFNTGHTPGTTLSEDDRMALIEYLKSL